MRISSGWNAHSAPIFKSTFTLTLSYLNTVASFVYQAVNNTLPPSLNNYFVFNKDVHDLFTTRKENIHILHCNLNVRAFSVKNYGPQLWNSIPSSIRSDIYLKIFKYKLKVHLLQKYT